MSTWQEHIDRGSLGGIDYGSEWNASLGFKLGPVNLMAKYANYDANGFAVHTEKVWLQAEFALRPQPRTAPMFGAPVRRTPASAPDVMGPPCEP